MDGPMIPSLFPALLRWALFFCLRWFLATCLFLGPVAYMAAHAEEVKRLPSGEVVLSKERAAELEELLNKLLQANAELGKENRALIKELELRKKDRCI